MYDYKMLNTSLVFTIHLFTLTFNHIIIYIIPVQEGVLGNKKILFCFFINWIKS
jgi:hypothetical protein